MSLDEIEDIKFMVNYKIKCVVQMPLTRFHHAPKSVWSMDSWYSASSAYKKYSHVLSPPPTPYDISQLAPGDVIMVCNPRDQFVWVFVIFVEFSGGTGTVYGCSCHEFIPCNPSIPGLRFTLLEIDVTRVCLIIKRCVVFGIWVED